MHLFIFDSVNPRDFYFPGTSSDNFTDYVVIR